MSPRRAQRPCSQPGCPALVAHGSRCTLHQRQQTRVEDARRGSRHARGYGTAWDKTRAELLPLVYARDKGICQLRCKKPVSLAHKAPHPRSATLDHVIPKSKGGMDVMGNLRLACYGCNSARGNRNTPMYATVSKCSVEQ